MAGTRGNQATSDPEIHEVYAVKYGTMQNRQRHDNFIAADPHEGPMPLDYFVWAIVNGNRTIVVDTGFDSEEGRRRKREIQRLPREGLSMLGIDAATVQDVVITHMHYDHAGSLGLFPAARFHMQADEMAYVTGPCMGHDDLRHPFTADHVCEMVRNVYSGRVSFSDGDAEIAPNLTVHKIGGHTRGLQCVRVLTRRGWVVLASDASHFYENFEQRKLFPIVLDAQVMLRGFERLEELADSPRHIVPGHDPLVRALYPAEEERFEGIVHRLDVEPKPVPR